MSPVRVAVVGHVEWAEFATVERMPAPGDIVAARGQTFSEPAGGGAVAAVQLARLAGEAAFFTSVGDDDLGQRAARELRRRHGVDVHAAVQPVAQRRAFTHLDASHERTITVLGERHVPHGSDPLPWQRLADYDAVYFTGGDGAALRAARAARFLVATPRAFEDFADAGVELDVLVASGVDEGERARAESLRPAPRHLVFTAGERGGTWTGADGTSGEWAAAEVPGPPIDAYGCGDSFAAGVTYGLGAGLGLPEALDIASRCGASCLAGRGPYGNQLRL